jgi:hypothetical protein
MPVTAYVEHVAVGGVLPEMPLFLDADTYINAPLETTYQVTWAARWRAVLERPAPAPRRKRRR